MSGLVVCGIKYYACNAAWASTLVLVLSHLSILLMCTNIRTLSHLRNALSPAKCLLDPFLGDFAAFSFLGRRFWWLSFTPWFTACSLLCSNALLLYSNALRLNLLMKRSKTSWSNKAQCCLMVNRPVLKAAWQGVRLPLDVRYKRLSICIYSDAFILEFKAPMD